MIQKHMICLNWLLLSTRYGYESNGLGKEKSYKLEIFFRDGQTNSMFQLTIAWQRHFCRKFAISNY